MGNLIKDFWTYTYKDQQYFGICEVVLGENIAQKRDVKKYETHIERALSYVMGKKIMSHMSIQKYSTWLKDRASREESEQKYYPFTLEFEAKGAKEYNEVVFQATIYVTYLITELQINEKDILIMINNSRSIYVMVNPKAYGLRPDKDLHDIYFEMYKNIKNDLGLNENYVDEGIIKSGYKLMKTPNSYYKDGFFVYITFDELGELLKDHEMRSKFTAKQRSLNFDIPGQGSLAMGRLYQEAKDRIKGKNTKLNTNEINMERKCDQGCDGCKCVEFFKSGIVGKGTRNYALVSVAISLKNQGYTKEQVIDELIELRNAWSHDENERDIISKVNTIFRRDYKFSCEYARAVYSELEIQGLCDKCSWNKNSEESNEIKINGEVINELWTSNASTRHYLMYLELLKKKLMNKWFTPAEEGINDRTIRELCNLTGKLNREKAKDKIYITYSADFKGYKLPGTFIEKTVPMLGDYIKHYLKLIVKGYKSLNKYVLIRISKAKIMSDLGYSDMSSVYKLISKLQELGLVITKGNNVNCVYYESYKVIDIHGYKEEKRTAAEAAAKKDTIIQPTVVNGDQLIIDDILILPRNSKNNKKINRGSPG